MNDLDDAELDVFDELETDDDEEDDELEAESDYDDEDLDDEAAEFLPLPIPGLFPFSKKRKAPRTGRGRGYGGFAPGLYATKAEVRRGFAKVGADVRRNGAAIKTLSGRINGVQKLAVRQGRQIVKLSRQNVRQDRRIRGVVNDLKKTREMNLLMFLLTRPRSTTPTTAAGAIGGTTVPAGSKLLYETGSSNSLLLPLVLMGGLGGSGGGGGSSDTLLLALALGGSL